MRQLKKTSSSSPFTCNGMDYANSKCNTGPGNDEIDWLLEKMNHWNKLEQCALLETRKNSYTLLRNFQLAKNSNLLLQFGVFLLTRKSFSRLVTSLTLSSKKAKSRGSEWGDMN